MFTGLLDDAAIFPPGNLPLAEAVRAHLAHRAAPYAALLGPLVVGIGDLPALGEITAALPAASLELAVTVPSPGYVLTAVERVRAIPAARLSTLEVAVPDGVAALDVVPVLDTALGTALDTVPDSPLDVTGYVEVPRDERRASLLATLAGSAYRAKFRTGGVRADLHPDEAELAAAITGAVRAGVAFKATAGLHHAVRNTDTVTGFEQHGFLNVLVATDAAVAGADEATVHAWLAERNGARLAARVADLSPAVREVLCSFGTCSITEPVAELTDLGLLALEVTR
ncbi:MAG: hypothetical protein L0H31_00795 [Nocardioidaceae bacterium]|nr:hypothetical protein [Nocardioidaceae bacterium]